MALQDSFITGDDGANYFQGVSWYAQTFTAGASYSIESVKLLLYKLNSPGEITVSIRETSGGLPTGVDLCSGTTDGDTLPTGSPPDYIYEWREITFAVPYNLVSGTVYSIVIRCAGTGSNRGYWRRDANNGYVGGKFCGSSNSGTSWSQVSGGVYDALFETYGTLVGGTTYHLSGTIAGISSCSGDVSVLTIISISGSFAGVSVFSGELSLAPLVADWLITRPIAYDPLDVWSKDLQLWGTYPEILSKSGGRYNNRLIVIGIDSDGLGVIYNG